MYCIRIIYDQKIIYYLFLLFFGVVNSIIFYLGFLFIDISNLGL